MTTAVYSMKSRGNHFGGPASCVSVGYRRNLRKALKTVEKKRLNIFNNLVADGLRLDVKDVPCTEFSEASLTDVTSVHPIVLFKSSFHENEKDILAWAAGKIELLLKDSEFMESMGYVQTGYGQFKRSLDRKRVISVHRSSDWSDSCIYVDLVDPTVDDMFGTGNDLLERIVHARDIRTPLIRMERNHMDLESVHMMSQGLRDLLFSEWIMA